MMPDALHSTDPDRRRVLLAGTALALAAAMPVQAEPAAPSSFAAIMSDGAAFDRNKLLAYARDLAKRPYAAPNPALPDGFQNLSFEAYNGIKNRPERAIWADNPRGFIIEPLHRGFIYQAPVSLGLVEDGVVRVLAYSSAAFDFGKLTPPQAIDDIGFSGFRVLSATGENPPRDIAVFQGASFLRAIAKGQRFGTISRALSLRTAEPRGEEFPFFRAFWIERPFRDDTLVVHGLLDSESVSGLFSFTLHVTDMTLIDTEATIFPRVALDNFGIAGMQTTYLHGFPERRNTDDYRPQVLDANGLSLAAGNGEWIWRPLSNPRQLQVSMFAADKPKGFGLLLRDRDFASYQDVDARFDLRPSLWMEPIGEWGAGALQLVEIPSDNEIHDNVIVQWRPKETLAAGSEFFFSYRQNWGWSPPEKPPLAIVTNTRIGRAGPKKRRFFIDFSGDPLNEMPFADIKLAIWASNNGIQQNRIIPAKDGTPFRVIFDLDIGNESNIELRLALMNATAPVSETWLYRWMP